MRPIAEIHAGDLSVFETEYLSTQTPVVIRGLVTGWPLLADSPAEALARLRQLVLDERPGRVRVVEAQRKERGFIGYSAQSGRLNFSRRDMRFDAFVEKLGQLAQIEDVMALALQSTFVDEIFPELASKLSFPLFSSAVRPRIWIGNQSSVGAHFDDADNIACVAMGRRKFILFPPGQIENLYIGPIDYTPAGAPTTLMPPEADLGQYPKFEKSLSVAQSAVLAPGDAIFIPTLWWHQVEALSKINVLVNYWHGGAVGDADADSVFDALLHVLMATQSLSPEKLKAWSEVFDYFVFRRKGDPLAHIPKDIQGILGGMSESQKRKMRAYLSNKLGSKT
ncbi:Cupin-like domain-containing protein [Microbulbifer donghaiensis]|uniref:Cupin-like domain-containing protein n=1 Tax=Microbulbifer donghaiensis TaxID=494016 RepID=A0A1M4Y6T2_9GAMM|nr:cupin-like domain-containing protein [Microbulbifer donghaiensis]SHF01283.1 Cupin-like domain-containing protein [Microbulbifer donghaiensis]